ncbi:hypothetical protein A8F94_03195 [Bacillus sp. FJAT-27225]|uniref:Hsp20/alpha crystallin family protein n=1 Tax=Bacillus sp. FJAT-27225 TaxID=1743144 RepID=UPI00080C2A3D|nr:Hsp20/alpha crystallin family protein [Bacillus sp. FJAT-27225]OCA90888.1 hypothetical protein A8F94_03195 [Bacillus sp. FJAT-27225]
MEDKKRRNENKELASAKPKADDHRLTYINDLFHYPPVKGFLQTIDDFFQNPFTRSSSFRTKLEENDKEYIVTAELPGVKRDQIKIEIYRNQVVISFENKVEQVETDELHGSYKRSFSKQLESRSVYLQKPILDNKAKASYADGLLTITLPIDKGHTLEID